VKTLLSSLLLMTALGVVAYGQTPRIVTAKEANGTYRYRQNEIKILALGDNRLRVNLDLIYAYKSQFGREANEGSAFGEATIENDTAVFHPPDSTACTITIKFVPGNRIRVTQTGDSADCGFGAHVIADGTYVKRSSQPPKFDAKP
jgi:hypothetical protein